MYFCKFPENPAQSSFDTNILKINIRSSVSALLILGT